MNPRKPFDATNRIFNLDGKNQENGRPDAPHGPLPSVGTSPPTRQASA
jgi:hypothetical protein